MTPTLTQNSALYFAQHTVREEPSFWRRIVLRAEKRPIVKEPHLRRSLFRWPQMRWKRRARMRQYQ